MLRLEKVSKTYRQGGSAVHALRDLDLHVTEPGFVGVMGRSGSGKSTLLQLAAGLDTADAGRISVMGQLIGSMNEQQRTMLRRRNIGVVFQQFNLIASMTAWDNIALPGVLDGRPAAWIEQRVDELLEQLGLSERRDHRPDALSGGEQQRVAIARALMFMPPLLLADEPTGSLDSATSDQLWRLLADVARKQQMLVLMVTHEPAAAVHCREVFVLGDGRIIDQFDVGDMDAGDVAARYQRSGR